jgi:hypothetical protein
VADYASHWVYSYQVQPDGTLAHKQKYYHLHVPDAADDAYTDKVYRRKVKVKGAHAFDAPIKPRLPRL